MELKTKALMTKLGVHQLMCADSDALEVLSTILLNLRIYISKKRKETNLSLREMELVVQEKKVEIEKERVEMEMQDRAAARDFQSSTMLAIVSLMKSLTEKL
jgi:hypothetical protein